MIDARASSSAYTKQQEFGALSFATNSVLHRCDEGFMVKMHVVVL